MYYPRIKRSELGTQRNLAIEGFGHRIYDSQTVYEYLIEFLIIFASPKYWESLGTQDGGAKPIVFEAYRFPTPKGVRELTGRLHYQPVVRMGLKRFIFYDRSKQEHRFEVDKHLTAELRHELGKNITCNAGELTEEDAMSVIQDVFYGFTAVVKNRAWFAQALLPICPELALCEAMGSSSKRKNMHRRLDALSYSELDGPAGFQFYGHYFLARGGEVYFLHILRGIVENPDLTDRLERGLTSLLRESFPQLSWLSEWIEDNWLVRMKEYDATPVTLDRTCEWIPEGYSKRAVASCLELINLLEAELPSLQKLDLLAKGIVLHVLRMMSEQAHTILGERTKPIWLIDISSKPGSNMRKHATASYRACEEDFTKALDTLARQPSDLDDDKGALAGSSRVKALTAGSRFTTQLFRKLGKDLGLIIPPKGPGARLTLNEDLVQFLVLSLIKPGQKTLLSTFLADLKEHYGMVIGPDELPESMSNVNPGDLDANQAALQTLLKQCGFLKDLSDATSIVENTFGGSAR